MDMRESLRSKDAWLTLDIMEDSGILDAGVWTQYVQDELVCFDYPKPMPVVPSQEDPFMKSMMSAMQGMMAGFEQRIKVSMQEMSTSIDTIRREVTSVQDVQEAMTLQLNNWATPPPRALSMGAKSPAAARAMSPGELLSKQFQTWSDTTKRLAPGGGI